PGRRGGGLLRAQAALARGAHARAEAAGEDHGGGDPRAARGGGAGGGIRGGGRHHAPRRYWAATVRESSCASSTVSATENTRITGSVPEKRMVSQESSAK